MLISFLIYSRKKDALFQKGFESIHPSTKSPIRIVRNKSEIIQGNMVVQGGNRGIYFFVAAPEFDEVDTG
jgi:hypothetical protein